jgi:hypothetical protein
MKRVDVVDEQKLPTNRASEYLRERGLQVEATTMKQWRFQRKGPVYHCELSRIYYRPEDLDAFIVASVRRIDPAATVCEPDAA